MRKQRERRKRAEGTNAKRARGKRRGRGRHHTRHTPVSDVRSPFVRHGEPPARHLASLAFSLPTASLDAAHPYAAEGVPSYAPARAWVCAHTRRPCMGRKEGAGAGAAIASL